MEQKKQIGNSEVQQRLKALEKKDPDMQCGEGKKIVRLCANPSCQKNSLRCSDIKCTSCGKEVHPLCMSVAIQEFTLLLNEKIGQSKDFMLGILQIQNSFTNAIKNSQKEFLDKYALGNLEESLQRVLTEIYDKKNVNALSGKQAAQLCQNLQKQSANNNEKTKTILDQYNMEIDKMMEEIMRIKHYYFSHFVSKQNFVKLDQIDSKIVNKNSEEGKRQIDFLDYCLNTPKRVQLLFRASEHDFRVEKFHQICDNVEDTMVLVKTQFNKIIGGFSKYKWNQEESGHYVNDTQRQSFLMQLNMKQKMVAQNDRNLIKCYSGSGPIFGGDFSDLFIADRCHNNNQSYSNFPMVYNGEQTKFTNGESSYHAFSGAKGDRHFRVLEWEVFKIVWKKKKKAEQTEEKPKDDGGCVIQ